jgi:hypothetical protein
MNKSSPPAFPWGLHVALLLFLPPQLSLRRAPIRGGVLVSRNGLDAILILLSFSGGGFTGVVAVVGDDIPSAKPGRSSLL